MAGSFLLQALTRLAGAGSRAAPAMESSAAALRAARMARAARGTDSMKGANQRFDLVGKPKFGDVVPAGPVTTPPGSALAARGSTTPIGGAPPAPAGGGALATRGPGGASPDIYGRIGGAMLTGGVGANVASESPTSIFDYLPKRAEGDPAEAMNRRNMPPQGLPDDTLGGFSSSNSSDLMPDRGGLPDDTLGGFSAATPRQDEGRSDSDALFRSLTGGSQRGPAANVPLPPPRPSDGLSSQELFQRYNDAMQRDDSGQAALFAQADKAMREGRASGGSAGGALTGGAGKDAAIHKALEIIHHLLTRR